MPSIEEAWNLPISAEMSSRQQQQQQQQKTVQIPYQKSQDMIGTSPHGGQPPPYNSSKPDNSLENNTKRIKVNLLNVFLKLFHILNTHKLKSIFRLSLK